MKKILGLIPARLKSTRLKNKVLLKLGNFPLLYHVYKRACLSKKLDEVIVCCDDKKIQDAMKIHGVPTILTSKKHQNGTERIFEGYKKLKKKYDLIVDIQGDEPLIKPSHIDDVINFHLKNNDADIILPTISVKIFNNYNLVKVVKNEKNFVLYISRQDVPYSKSKKKKINKHLSIISFKPKALLDYNKSKKGLLEKNESVELLRALEIGLKIKSFELNGDSFSVDVKKDYINAQKQIEKDKIYQKYKF